MKERFSLKVKSGPNGLIYSVGLGDLTEDALSEAVTIDRLDEEIDNLISQLEAIKIKALDLARALKPH